MSVARTPKRHTNALCLVLVLLVIVSTEARADLFGFAPISNNSGVSGTVADQLAVDVSPYGTNQVLFTFYNDGPSGSDYDVLAPIPGIITGVYFDDGALLGLATILDVDFDATAWPGVDFDHPANGQENFAEGGSLDPPFETTAGFSASLEKGPGGIDNGVGVNPSEALGIVFDLKPNYDFAGVIGAIGLGISDPASAGSLRIGVRVQGLGEDNEFSDSLIHTPVPAALVLGMLGLGVAGLKLRRFA